MSAATASTAMTPGKLSPLGTRSPERVIARRIDSASGEGVLIADAVGAATEAAEDVWTAGMFRKPRCRRHAGETGHYRACPHPHASTGNCIREPGQRH